MDELPAIYLQAATIGMTAAVAPGALLTFLINQTLLGGWRRGALVALSVLISDPPIVLSILFLLNQLPDQFIRWVSLAGGLFVLYMAWGIFKSLQKETQHQALEGMPPSARQTLLRGAMMNLLSPGVYTFWTLALGPLLLQALRQSPAHGAAFVGGFYSAFIGGMLAVAALFHQARRLGPGIVRRLAQVSVIVLVIFGIILLHRGLV
jgi:threonine/homoserine/homoserine lactone efflux protein